jgi:hypothetical protein
MTPIIIYKIGHDNVFGGDVEIFVSDPVKTPIPAGHTRASPHPIPDGHYAVMRSGWKYVVGNAPEAPDIATPAQWEAIRAQRDAKLAASDWTQLADAPVYTEAWATYRQELRDLPQVQTDPFNITWPVEP